MTDPTSLRELRDRVAGLSGRIGGDATDVVMALCRFLWMLPQFDNNAAAHLALGAIIDGSIDAAIKLVEQALPGWAHASGNVGEDDRPWATLTEPNGACRDFAGSAIDESVAMVAALLDALLAQGTEAPK